MTVLGDLDFLFGNYNTEILRLAGPKYRIQAKWLSKRVPITWARWMMPGVEAEVAGGRQSIPGRIVVPVGDSLKVSLARRRGILDPGCAFSKLCRILSLNSDH